MRQRSPLIILTLVIIFSGAYSAMAIEEAPYEVVKVEGDFEVRDYAPHLLAETFVEGDFEDAGSSAFKRLFRYISGDNRSQTKIAMTAPVSQQSGEKIAMTAPVGQQKSGDQWVVSFMMPASYTVDTIPVPDDPAVVLREVPAHRAAAIRYSGGWSKARYEKHLALLEGWIEQNKLKAAGEPVWARYNAPFTPWFMRRNEILITLMP